MTANADTVDRHQANQAGAREAGARAGFADALEPWRASEGLPTPHLAVLLDRLRLNLEQVASIAHAHAVRLRPHVKTHKCIEIARMQLECGAVGITASKPQEALVFIEAGLPSVTVAYPIVAPQAAQTLLQAAERRKCDLRFVVDSVEGAGTIALGVGQGRRAPIFLEIDVGLERCGVKPGSASLEKVVRAVRDSPKLEFRGILSHAGHAYGASGRREIAAIADDERRQLRSVVDALAAQAVDVEEVSVGSTPTVLGAESFAGVTEIRPGNYVFLDATACRLGVAKLDQVSLGIITSVVSVNERYCIIDAGSKVLSSDTGPHGTGGGGFGLCFALGPAASSWGEGRRVARLSEEHGFVEHGGEPLPIGARALVLPNHSCPAVNLADRLVVLEEGRDPQFWVVAARGRTT